MDHELNGTNRRPGYRLHRLELYNWGTFDSTGGQVYRFEPCGRTALMVGHNGSGKSTLVDALLTLLVVSGKRSYNVAAGAKASERNEESYIRGAVGRTSDDSQFTVVKYLRERGSTYSAISAVFRDETLDRAFTLCVILHLTANGTDKVFALADEDRELRDDLQALRSSDAIKSHFDALGYRTTKTFSEYHGWLTRRTGMRPKAMDLFNQTVSVKDIQSLNDFIRKRMLEAHDWREKVDRLLTHFNDLSIAHQELVRARRSQELLIPVERHGIRYREQALELTELENMRDAADSFFACETIRLFTPEVERLSDELEAVSGQKKRLGDEISQAEQRKWELSDEIKRAGGDRLQRIPDLIKIETEQLKRKQEAFLRFHTQLRQAGIDRGVGSADELTRVRSELLSIQTDSVGRLESATEMHEAAISERGTLRKELRAKEEELAILNERRTNLPPNLATLRERLCADLDLDESTLLFASELMAVGDAERQWEASVELVLNPFARTLLVQEQFYRRVRNYIESHRLTDRNGTGQRLEYTKVGRARDNGGDRIHARSLYRKLVFRDHNLTPWVKAAILNRFDYRCCDTVEEFDHCDMAITVNRHIKRGRDHHIKDDRRRAVDPLSFILGWNNHDKKRRLSERIQELQDEERRFKATIEGHSEAVTRLRRRLEAVEEALALHDFDTIDVQRHQREIDALEKEKAQLESDNEVVQTLKKRLAETEELLVKLKADRDEFVREEDRLSKFIDQGKLALANADRDVEAARANGEMEQNEPFFDAIRESLCEPLSFDDLHTRGQEWKAQVKDQILHLTKALEGPKDKLVGAMNKYLNEMREENADLTANVNCLDSFLDRLQQIRDEDLPRFADKFKEGLNDKVSQEIGTFHSGLRRECQELVSRIEQLNAALSQLDFNTDTFIRLEPRQASDRAIDEFKNALRECLAESFENTDDANEARFVRIQSLVERMANKEEARWRDHVIDVRNWYNFVAHEIDTETSQIRDEFDGSSGRSGGEKAKLAFTILVAAIAYQNDIDPDEMAPGRFHFVVVDEMFSKIDDENAKRALRLFERFGLQLLIVAPLDAKARVTEPFVDSYLHVVKDESANRSQLFSMTAREYDEVVRAFEDDSITTDDIRRAPK